MWQTTAGRTHIGEEGPPHQGEETRHFEVFEGLSTTSRESGGGGVPNTRESARLRRQIEQVKRKIYLVVNGDRRVPSSRPMWSPSRYVGTSLVLGLTGLVLALDVW